MNSFYENIGTKFFIVQKMLNLNFFFFFDHLDILDI